MDRLKEDACQVLQRRQEDLHSSMDRLKVENIKRSNPQWTDLHSSMDRLKENGQAYNCILC